MTESPMHAHNRQAARDQSRKDAALPKTERHDQPPPNFDYCDPFLQIVAKGHFDHEFWKQAGRCVYCSCGHRLFQGNLKLLLKTAHDIEVVDE